MRKHTLHIVTTGRQELDQVAAIARSFPPDMVDVLHIREKHRSAREIIEWYHTLRESIPGTRIHINDRIDAAAAVQADGVQLGYTAIPPEIAKQMLPGARIGCSVHSTHEAARAQSAGADYLIFGHIYRTGSKEGLEGRGIAALAEAVTAADLPVIAIGGIEPHRVKEVLSTGCAGIAIMSSVFLHKHPASQIEQLRHALDCSDYTPRRRYG